MICAFGPPAVLAAKAATATIPIVFVTGADPVKFGFVASFNRPGGNATGIWMVSTVLAEKRLQLMRELLPKAELIAMLVNPTSPVAEPQIRDAQAAARKLSLKLTVLAIGSNAAIRELIQHKKPQIVCVELSRWLIWFRLIRIGPGALSSG